MSHEEKWECLEVPLVDLVVNLSFVVAAVDEIVAGAAAVESGTYCSFVCWKVVAAC